MIPLEIVMQEVKLSLLKVQRAKKGISPILATLLLIVIAVGAIMITYAWVITFTTTQTQQAGAILVLENVRFYGEPATAKNRTDIVISNTGTADAKIVRVYVGTSSGNIIDVSVSSDLGTGKVVYTGKAITIKINWPNSLSTEWESGKTYYFKVAPEAGASFDFNRKAP